MQTAFAPAWRGRWRIVPAGGVLTRVMLYAMLFASAASPVSARTLTGSDLDTRPVPTDVLETDRPQVLLDPVNGSQPGTAGVNLFRGDFTPSLPLAVLPARGGLAPELSLVYSAQRGDTALGSGWQFGFMSTIERRAADGGTPDMYGVIDDPSAAFEFRIDGALLVPSPDGDGTYRSEHDAFTVYTPVVNWFFVTRVVAWEVRRDGITRTYGSDANSGFCQDGVEYATADCVEPTRWYLTRIQNAHGNVIDIAYESFRRGNVTMSHDVALDALEARSQRIMQDRYPGIVLDRQAARPPVAGARTVLAIDAEVDRLVRAAPISDRIQTDHLFATEFEQTLIGSDSRKLLPVTLTYNGGSHVIALVYENRPDVRAEWQDGVERTLFKRVARVDVSTIRDDVEHLAFRYDFDYRQALSDGRSLLTAVHQQSVTADADGTPDSMLLQSFDYADRALSALAWDPWEPLAVQGETLVPAHYEFSDEMETKAFSSSSILVNVDADAQPDLIALNTDCEASPPEQDDGPGQGPTGGGPDPGDVGTVEIDKGVVDIPRTALSRCLSHHRVFLNEPDGTGRKFVYDDERSDQLNERLGPLQQVVGSVDYLIVDLDGDGIADLVAGDVDNGRSDLAVDRRYYKGTTAGWNGEGQDLPWAPSLDGHDPFRDLQLADVNADGKPDLAGDTEYFLNTGSAPFFSSSQARPLQVYDTDGDARNLPTDLPPADPATACMARGAFARFALNDLGISRGFSDNSYQGTSDVDDMVSPAEWVWRNTSYSDANNDGITDRVIALSWPEEAAIVLDLGTDTPLWQDAQGRCGGINRVYLGNGRGEFFQSDLSVGGLYDWYGGPRAREFSRNDVQTAPAVTFEYNPPVNHQTLVDFDGDGRAEMMQVCGTGWAHAIPDLNTDDTGHGLSEDSTSCPAPSVSLPAMWNGQAATIPPFSGMRDDAVMGGYFDVDGNGLADVFVAANPVNPGDPDKAGDDLPYWRKSTLATPQGRLTGIIGPYGGRTDLHWSVAGDGGQAGARLLTVIGSIKGMNGRTDFRFTTPTFHGGRFAGFEAAEAWGTSGVVQVTQFVTDNRRLGAIANEAEYAQDGTLHRLAVHLDRTQAEQVALDPVRPYFNPVYRTCSFDFETDAGETDPESFIDECIAFDGNEGPRGLLGDVIDRRSATTLRRPLPSLLRLTGREGSDAADRRASNVGKLPLKGFATGGDILATTADGRAVFQGPLDDIAVGDPVPVFITNNRLRVSEFEWDDLAGVLLVERALNDITTTEDSTISTFGYHPWNDTLAVQRLHTRKTVNVVRQTAARLGEGTATPVEFNLPSTRRDLEYPLADYAGTDWGREIQRLRSGLLPAPDRQRARTRTFDDGAIVRETAWGETRAVSFSIDDCGLVSRRTTPLGWEVVERDDLCRETRKETRHGRRELITHDGFGRARASTSDSVLPGPKPQRDSTLRLDYDPQAGPSLPAAVAVSSGADGPQTVTKSYVDEYGRNWKQVVCERRAGALDTWTTSLDQAYPCADPARTITTVTLYDALSGLEGFQSLPFGDEGSVTLGGTATHSGLVPVVQLADVAGTRTRHDRFGQLREQVLPDGRVVSHSYDLGRETTAGDGLTVDLLRRGVITTLLRNGLLMRNARLNAFGEQVEEVDALGNITTYGFDAWGRRVSTTLPETEVWDGCAGPPLRKRTTERATFSDNDDVLTITDTLGNRVTKQYDRHGRVTEIRGPDDTIREQRIYDDGFDSLILDDLLDPVPDLPGGVLTPGRTAEETFRPRSVQTLDGMGNTYTVWLDAFDRPYRQKAADGTESLTQFDDRGREARRTTPTGEIVTMGYDWLDRPVAISVDSGTGTATETREYDPRGNLVRTVDADGEVRLRTFDAMNRLLAETLGDPARRTPLTIARHEYDDNGRIAESTVNGVRTAFRYDDAGRLTRQLTGYDPDANVVALMRETLTYGPRDEVETATDRRGQAIRSTYDERGRVVARETLFGGTVLARTEAGYDGMDRLVRSVDEAGDVTCHEYDAYGRVVTTTPPGLGTRKVEYTRDAPHPVTGKPTRSLRSRVIAPTGETVDSYVDGMARTWLTGNTASGYQQNLYEDGRMIRSERIGLDGVTAAFKRYDYADRSGRIAREWDWMEPADEAACVADPAVCDTGSVSFTYTAGGRQLSQTDAGGNATLSHYADDSTMLLARIDAAGVTQIRFEYDAAYPVVVAKERGPSVSAIRTEFGLDRFLRPDRTDITWRGTPERERFDYRYDESGHRVSTTLRRNGRLESTVDWTHDDFGRTRTKTTTAEGAPALSPGTSHVIAWDYTPTGRLGLVTYPSGNRVSYRYDGDGHLSQIDAGFGPGSTPIATFGKPDPSGRYLSVDIAGGVRIDHSYQAGREQTRNVQADAGSFQESYGYDALGRLRSTDRRGRNGAAETFTLDYDARDLLTQEAATGATDRHSYRYAFDALGRRSSKIAESADGETKQLYGYSSGSRLDRVTGETEATVTWDAYGRPADDHRGLAFEWGPSDQLRAIVLPDGQREDMMFDGDGQRIARRMGDVTDLFYSSDLSGEVMSQRRADGGYLDIVRDANGGVVALLDGDGAIIPWAAGKGDATALTGDAPGAALSAFGEGDAPRDGPGFGFHQMWSSALSPLRFAGVRVYDAETGRFLTPDPLGVTAASDPNDAVDLFRYAHNNPAALSDSTGYLGITPPTPTTIIVDGIAIDTFNVNAWETGTIRVANQAAYIAGVRAGIIFGRSQGWTLDEAVQFAIGNGPPERAGKSHGVKQHGGAGQSHGFFPGVMNALSGLFGKNQDSAQTFKVEDDQGSHTKATREAKRQVQGGGPVRGQVFDDDGVLTGAGSGADPTSNPFWVRVNGPNGEDVVGATSRETLRNFFAANPGYTPASKVFSSGDVETISVSPAPDTRSGFIRAVSAYWGIRTGVVKAAGGMVLESWNFLIHDSYGSRFSMIKCSAGYSCGFVLKSGFAASTNAYMGQGYHYPGAVFMTMSDGLFYGTIGGVEQMVTGANDGDWERVGESMFAVGMTVGGAAVGGALEGMAAPTTRAGLLGGIASGPAGTGTRMLMARNPMAPISTSTAGVLEAALDMPKIVVDGAGTPRAVLFGQERFRLAIELEGWMDDGVLADALHIGGFHGNADPSGFAMMINDDWYLVSPQQLAAAVERAVPGTTLAYDHLLTCCGAAQGGAGRVYTTLRNRPTLSYEVLVGVHENGRYISLTGKSPPLLMQRMLELDPATGNAVRAHSFQGRRSPPKGGGFLP